MSLTKITIVTDSGGGLAKQQTSELGTYYLPLQIIIQGRMFLDGEDITVEEIYEYLKNSEMPITFMLPVGLVGELFIQSKTEGYKAVIAVPLNGGSSSTFSVMQIVVKEHQANLHVTEPYIIYNIQRCLAISVSQLVEQGYDLEMIVERLRMSTAGSGALIIPDDLQHLKHGDRLTPLAAAPDGLPKVKPILRSDCESEGKVDMHDKVRIMNKAQSKAISTFQERGLSETYTFTVLRNGISEEGEKLKAMMERTSPGLDVYYGLIGAVISVHAGVGYPGIQYIRKVEM